MNEAFLQYVWANSLFRSGEYRSVDGKKIRILSVGRHNRDSGPDFFHARVEKEGITEAGNVEIHCRASDWKRHGHHTDAAYDNVILSVVLEYDAEIRTSKGRVVDTILLDFPEGLWEEYRFMANTPRYPRCFRHLGKIDPSRFGMHLSAYGVARLERKCGEVRAMLGETRNDWENCFYRTVTRYWSGHVNAEAFARLAAALPYRLVARCRDNLFTIEALLFGFSGLLETGNPRDRYVKMLREEYDYLASKFGLQGMPASCWKFMRIRPIAFPTVRMALLAAWLFRSQFIFSSFMEAGTIIEACRLLEVHTSAYWDTHYRFSRESVHRKKSVGKGIRQGLLINAVIPFLFVYGKERMAEEYCEKALEWLEALPAERNHLTEAWKCHGVRLQSALDSQAILQIGEECCEPRRCLHCRIGQEVFGSLACHPPAGT